MFDFAWSEIALIGVVALVLIGPKDMPVAVKAVANVVKKARRMAAEFQGHVDEMVRDTELAEVRKQIDEIRNFDIKGEFERTIDEDGSLRRAFDDPLVTPPPETALDGATSDGAALNGAVTAEEAGTLALAEPPTPEAAAVAAPGDAPDFIPPAIAGAALAPAFIPPQAVQGRYARPPFA